jgi:hypothetical protein
MLCFIFNRYQEFMDNLITSFMYHIRAFVNEAKDYGSPGIAGKLIDY